MKLGAKTGKTELITRKGSLRDIIDVVNLSHKDTTWEKQVEDIAKDIEPTLAGFEKAIQFLYDNVKYVEDPAGVQYIQSPSQLFENGQGDCKSFTLYINFIAKQKSIPYIIRYAGYEGDELTHVYSLLYLNEKWIPVDAVYLLKKYGGGKIGTQKQATVIRDFITKESLSLLPKGVNIKLVKHD